MHLNFEFKAKAIDITLLEKKLLGLGPKFIGEDHQIDTYFNSPAGRLKLREGNIENALIHYEREDAADAKTSKVILYQHTPDQNLKNILITTLGIKVVVDKRRKIYFIDNVKFHFDNVGKLGSFVEVEAIDADGTIDIDTLKQQAKHYSELFGIKAEDYIAVSYSDLLLDAMKIERTSE